MFLNVFRSDPLVGEMSVRRLRQAVEIALVAALAIQCGRLIWTVMAPLGAVGRPETANVAAPAADLAILARFDPFDRGVATTIAAAPAAEGFRLYGVRADGRGGGSAILAGPDGKQTAFSVGDDVAAGVSLIGVGADHVQLRRSGRTERLSFPAGAAPSPAYIPAVLNPPPAPSPTPPPERTTGYPLPAGGPAGEAIRAAGLLPGDTLVSVNGAQVTGPERIEALAADLTARREAVVQFQRDGQLRTATVRIAQP